jgi:hypothetical protein
VYKSFNRAVATASAGVLALGVHWVAGKTGEFEPYILTGSLFVLGRRNRSRALFLLVPIEADKSGMHVQHQGTNELN